MSGMAIPATTRLRQRGLASWRRAAAPAAPGAARLPGLGLALLAAVLLPVLTLSAMSRISWLASWSGAERELSRSAEAAAEYAVRTIEAQRFAADVTNDLLQGLSDAEVRDREAELHQALARLAGRLALVRHITVSDREARVLLSTSTASVPQPLSLADRDWVIALRQPGAPRWHVSRLFAGRLDGRLFFAVNRRREAGGNGLAAGAYDGAISVSMDPNAVAAGFTALGGEPGDVTALVRSDGEVLVRTPGAQEALPPIPAGSALRRAAAEGRARGSYVGHPLAGNAGQAGARRLIAFRQVADLPLYVTVARPQRLIAAQWRRTVARQLAIGVPASLLVIGLALLALRRSRAAAAAEAALQRETAQRAVAEARQQAGAEFRAVFDSGIMGMAIIDLRDWRALAVNDRLLEMTGLRRAELPARGIAWPPPGPAAGAAGPYWPPVERDWLRPDGSALPLRLASALLPGRPGRCVVIAQDITEQRQAEHRRDLLRREVDHRAKNALATARAALRLTRAPDLDSFVRAVDGRISALAEAMSVLADTGWEGAELETLLATAVKPFESQGDGARPRISLAGPGLTLAPTAVQPLAMAIHELATNATKYGALSVAGGEVSIRWEMVRATPPQLRILWRESGGPAAGQPPARPGFGTRVLEATIRSQLGGSLTQHWQEAGLACEIGMPAARVLRGAEA
ncbi:HWE histidine kinase domain-containing protein [Paeniroseomonas aquatica]|uniref:histidine kinase n=1 Tax=Paeniroseomonas aquatica TaxID=373043 RepID=A0ABT8AAW8_9PROT|nr:HWE histidine kinase domain-containing protein [Paeniroseomonas aquatica]MDN3566596.1 HWE histidine kinase domain-containing protein [Paeniroseomonas aquatica]